MKLIVETYRPILDDLRLFIVPMIDEIIPRVTHTRKDDDKAFKSSIIHKSHHIFKLISTIGRYRAKHLVTDTR